MDELPKVDCRASFVNKELINLNMFGKSITSSTAVDFSYSSNTTEYFYAEACLEPARRSRSDRRSRRDAPGTAYDNLGFFVNEILIGLAASGSGILRLPETQLIDIASGNPTYAQAITDLLNSEFDNSDITRPHAYLVWMMYACPERSRRDNNMTLDAASSGAAKVQNPNALETILRNHISVAKDGYCHVYPCPELAEWVSNGSTPYVNFDNFNVARVQGKVRQINDYGSAFQQATAIADGMPIYGLNGDHDDYLNKYTGKEYQTGEFDPSLSQGLEMMDFGSRFYDAQLGRWHTPDPAEQFSNPYLAMGNNPVMYVDPDGEFIHIVIGAAIGGVVNLGVQWYRANQSGQDFSVGDGFLAFGIGAGAGALGAATGGAAFTAVGGAGAGAGGFAAGFVGGAVGTAVSAPLQNMGNYLAFDEPVMTPGEYITSVAIGGAIGGVINGGIAIFKGNSFWSGNPKGGIPGNAGVNGSSGQNGGDLKAPNPSNRTTETYTTQGDGWEISIDGPTFDWKTYATDGKIWKLVESGNRQYGSNLTYGNSGSAGVPLRSFTYGNFRTNLSRYTGLTPPSKIHAHHIYPRQFERYFNQRGINIHDPQYGAWWDAAEHLPNAARYNAEWQQFIQMNPNASQTEVLMQGRLIMGNYGF